MEGHSHPPSPSPSPSHLPPPSAAATLLDVGSQNVLAFFLRAQSLYPVYRRLVDMLGPADLITLSRTCRGLSHVYRDLVATDWNLNRTLTTIGYTADPQRFRSALNETKAVIGGSFALDFFDRNVTRASQMEIVMGVYAWDRTLPKDYIESDVAERGEGEGREMVFVRRNNCETLFRFLVDVEGYELTEDDLADDDAVFHRMGRQPEWVTDTLVKKTTGARIRLMHPHTNCFQGRRAPLSEVGLYFPHSHGIWGASGLCCLMEAFAHTAGACFILSDRAISLFPRLTFTYRAAYTMSESVFMDLDYGKCAQALVRRDILPTRNFLPVVWSPSTCLYRRRDKEVIDGPRWFVAQRRLVGPTAWVIPLDMAGVVASAVPPSVVDAAHVTLEIRSDNPAGQQRGEPQGQRIKFRHYMQESACLRYTYCCGRLGYDDDTLDMIGLTKFLHEKAKRAWMAHYDKNISASNSFRMADRTEQSILQTETELIREAPRLSPEWFKDDQVAGWLREYLDRNETEVAIWEHDDLPRLEVPGITPQPPPEEQKS